MFFIFLINNCISPVHYIQNKFLNVVILISLLFYTCNKICQKIFGIICQKRQKFPSFFKLKGYFFLKNKNYYHLSKRNHIQKLLNKKIFYKFALKYFQFQNILIRNPYNMDIYTSFLKYQCYVKYFHI